MSSPDPDPMTLVLDRLTAIEARLDRALATGSTARASPVAAPSSKLLTTDEACEILRCRRTTLDGHAARGLCTQHRPKGRGPGKTARYVREEIETLAVSEEAARELMARKKKRPR